MGMAWMKGCVRVTIAGIPWRYVVSRWLTLISSRLPDADFAKFLDKSIQVASVEGLLLTTEPVIVDLIIHDDPVIGIQLDCQVLIHSSVWNLSCITSNGLLFTTCRLNIFILDVSLIIQCGISSTSLAKVRVHLPKEAAKEESLVLMAGVVVSVAQDVTHDLRVRNFHPTKYVVGALHEQAF